jgi:signal transduction histidine kinase/CheY-like chemotaxis protein
MRPSRWPDAVYAEQVRATYGQLPLTLSVSVLNSALLGFVLAPDVANARILGWIGCIAGLSALRFVLWYVHGRRDVGPQQARWWTYLAIAGAFGSGILWGSGVLIFTPLGEARLLFLALLVCGMCAGAATVHAAHFPTVVAYIVPAVLPLTAYFLMADDRLHIFAGVLAGVFGVSLCISSLRFQRWFRETTSARLALASQTLAINAANARLKDEMDRHRSTEAMLHHAQKMEAVGRLTAGVAHDFNNLLMAIGGSAELLARDVAADPQQGRLVETIQRSVERGTALTRQLLVFGRKQTLVPRLLDINEMLTGIEKLLVSTLGGYARLELRLDRRSPLAVLVDADQLENSILNLVINASDAMPNGGEVIIRTDPLTLDGTGTGSDGLTGEFVSISVSDTGSGMTEEVRLRAFDPFFTTKEPGKGSGLGLSQVYGLVQQSGGTVHLDSRPAAGTTVSIFLPRARDALPAMSRAPRETAAAVRSVLAQQLRRILLVDDDEQVRETLAEMLGTAGYSVASCATAALALGELDAAHRIDLIIVDLAMPTVRGDLFAAQARSLRADVPVLFITGYAETDALRTERWVLRKPFDAATLITTIEQALRVAA